MPLVTTDEVEALISPGIETDALEDVIAREEAWLARKIGPLTGMRTVTLRPDLASGPLTLRRPAASVLVTMGEGGLVEATLGSDGLTILPPSLTRWVNPVVVTFTPTDEAEVKRAVIDLVRLAVTTSPYSQEGSEGHSYSRRYTPEFQREVIARRLVHRPKTASVSFLG